MAALLMFGMYIKLIVLIDGSSKKNERFYEG